MRFIVFITCCLLGFTACQKEDLGNTQKPNHLEINVLLTRNGYQHFCQHNASTCGGTKCGPTAYMIARKLVFPDAAFGDAELSRIATGVQHSCVGGTYIENIANFAQLDIGACQPLRQRVIYQNIDFSKDSTVQEVLGAIKKSLLAQRPVIAEVRKHSAGYLSNSFNEPAYLHYVIVVGIAQFDAKSNIGDIFYIDPESPSEAVYQVPIEFFLSGMRLTGTRRNFLQIGCD